MKGVTNASGTFKGVPFRNANGKYVVPIKCTSGGRITVDGLPAGTYAITYTTGSSYNVSLPAQTIPTGGWVTFNMPAAGVVTVYETGYLSGVASTVN
jgi:hypothetical protein